MKTVKAVFSDIDGTLLNSEDKITAKTKEAVQRMEQKNIPFVLVSARLPSGMSPMQKELELSAPMICYGGALVIDPNKENEVIYEETLPAKAVKAVYTTVRDEFSDISCAIYSQDEWMVNDPDNEWIKREEKTVQVPPVQKNLDEYVEEEPKVYKILCTGDAAEIEKLEKTLNEELSDVTVHKSKENNLEVVPKEASKDTAIKTVMERLKVKQEEIMAIGDNFNDIDMLSFAGVGVAMGNAPDEVKESADEVTAGNDEDGVQKILEKYFE